MTGDGELRVLPVRGLPEIDAGAALGAEIAARAELRDDDAVVISQKVVSKAEGRVVALASVEAGDEARRLASELDREPEMVELILRESRAVLRAERGVLIVETRHGLICANAGIDASNLPEGGTACLLPENPDGSARRLRAELAAATGARLGVIVADSFGRAWRLGQAEVAIGCAGIAPLDDWRGRPDAEGRELAATVIAVADQAAGAADLVRDKTDRVPVAVVRGLSRHVTAADGPGATAIRRPPEDDLFR